MHPIRMVYSKLPQTLQIPEEFQDISAEIIIWPLETQQKDSKTKRPFGLVKDLFQVSESFFDPLPESILSDFGVI